MIANIPDFDTATESGHLCQGGAMTGVADILEWARQRVIARVPKADLDQRDPDYIRDQFSGLWMLALLYFRADVRGLHRIPKEGPVLLVGNHSGGRRSAAGSDCATPGRTAPR